MSKMKHLTALALMSLCVVSVSSGLRCLRCNEVYSPILCTYITTCSPGEICGIEKVRNENGNVRYNLGCKSTTTCTDFGNRKSFPETRSAESSSTYTTLCHECCQNDICNAAGCGQLGYPFDVGAVCMNCENVDDPRNCDKVKACEDDEICYIDEKIVFHMRLFTSKCVQRHVCDPTNPDIFGRKKRDQFSVVKRSSNYCRKCCNSNLCNDNCGTHGGYSSYPPYYSTNYYYRTSTYPPYWISTYPPYTTTKTPNFTITFDTCGRNHGPTGPTLSECRSWYGYTWPRNGSSFNVISGGVQVWHVPETSFYMIEASGAAGGYGNGDKSLTGGKGARIKGYFFLNESTVLNIVVGQMGNNGKSSESGGGGGGTFVYTGSIGGSGLLIAAGGGGGAGEESTHPGYDGYRGKAAINGMGTSSSSTLGYGGHVGSYTTTGAGWKSVGEPLSSLSKGNSGQHWDGGNSTTTNAGAGGFGGGGSGVASNGGGGAGGYTGASGISSSNRNLWGGGGGGSFNSGSNQTLISGVNNGPGFVIISKL